jgi:nicotinamidase-related amidase
MARAAPTLFDLAGLRPRPAALSEAVLLVIDGQNEYVDGRLALPGIAVAMAETRRVLDRARDAGTPVLHIVHHGPEGAPLFDPRGPGSAIVPALAPEPDEAVLIKHLPNAFAGTDLAGRLQKIERETGRGALIVTGFMTHMCISSTVRCALDLGRPCTVVGGATATRDLSGPVGTVVTAAQVQAATLAALADRFAVIVRDAGDLAGG